MFHTSGDWDVMAKGRVFAESRAVSACVAVVGLALSMTSCATPAAAPSTTPTASAVAASTDLTSVDWSAIALPASSCVAEATGEFPIGDGTATVRLDELTEYAVAIDLPPDVGEAGGEPVAVVRYSCILVGSNGVGAFPIAVFGIGADGPDLIGIVDNDDLGVTSTGSSISHDSVEFIDGQIVIVGKFLTDTDPRCCASGDAWTSIAITDGSLTPTGVLTEGPMPKTLPSPIQPSSPTAGELIVYDPAVSVRSEADLDLLEGASEDFRRFVWGTWQAFDAGNPGCGAEIVISQLMPDTFAMGGELCEQGGGGAVIWHRPSGTWEVLMHYQSMPSCAALALARFPTEMYSSECLDANNQPAPYTG